MRKWSIFFVFILLCTNFCYNVSGENLNDTPPIIHSPPSIMITDQSNHPVGSLKVNEEYRLRIMIDEKITGNISINIRAVYQNVVNRAKYGLTLIYNVTPEKISESEKRSADAYEVEYKMLKINVSTLSAIHIPVLNVSSKVIDVNIRFHFAGAWDLYVFLSQDNFSYQVSITTLNVKPKDMNNYCLFLPILILSSAVLVLTFIWKRKNILKLQ